MMEEHARSFVCLERFVIADSGCLLQPGRREISGEMRANSWEAYSERCQARFCVVIHLDEIRVNQMDLSISAKYDSWSSAREATFRMILHFFS